MTPCLIVGWREYVHFPQWGISRVKAKVDTGARTSAIHAANYRILEEADNGPMVELELALHRKRPRRIRLIRTPLLRVVKVRDSGGHEEHRPVIQTSVTLGPTTFPVLFTVTNRQRMLFPVLLGRRALAGVCHVDVTGSYLLGK